MMRIIKLVLILSSFIFLVSCNKNDLDDIAKTGDWDKVKDITTEIIDIESEIINY